LQGIEEIAIIKLQESDIVRHRLVQRIVAAYEHPSNNKSRSYGSDEQS
jgi:phosphate starvation-inducible PhoH-like protein